MGIVHRMHRISDFEEPFEFRSALSDFAYLHEEGTRGRQTAYTARKSLAAPLDSIHTVLGIADVKNGSYGTIGAACTAARPSLHASGQFWLRQ
jgi:hypothetical protein